MDPNPGTYIPKSARNAPPSAPHQHWTPPQKGMQGAHTPCQSTNGHQPPPCPNQSHNVIRNPHSTQPIQQQTDILRQRLEAFNRSQCQVKLGKITNESLREVTTLNFYNKSHSHLRQHNTGLKPFLQLGSDVNDHYKPRVQQMTMEKQQLD